MASLARVGDLAEQIRGVTYGKEDASKAPMPGYLPVLRAGNITDSGLAFDDLVYVPEARVAAKQKIKKGDIVIAASSGSLDVVGKAAPALDAFDGGFGAFCKVLRPNNKVDAGYLAQFFKTPGYRRTISSLAAGANINNLKSEHLDDLRIPLPPLLEQRRIAAILDQADALRAKRREALAQLDSLTQSIFIEMFGDPRINDRNWSMRSVGDVTDCIVPGRDKPKSFSGSTPWVTTSDLVHLGTTMGSTKSIGLTDDEIRAVNARVIPQGSVVISCVGDLGIVSIAGKPMVVNQQLHSFQCGKEVDSAFLMYCLAFQKNFMLAMASSTTLPYMNKSVCNSIPIVVPPLALQQTFSTSIQAIESLKATHRAALAESDALFASLQHRAFTGAL